MSKETVTITLEEYKQLCYDAAKLRALEHGGVDNWTYYGDALEELPDFENFDEY